MRLDLRRTGSLTAMTVMALCALFAPGATACNPLSLAQRMAPGALFTLPVPRLAESAPGALASPEAAGDTGQSITGLWKTVSMSGGVVAMVAFDTFHSDGTEISLDGLFPPATGNVCPGTWVRTGPKTYSTVHPAFEYDPAGVNIVAIFIERMHVTISADGRSLEGTFTWDNYDFQGNLLPGSLAGTVTGTRITAGSPFPFPFPL